MVLQDFDFSKYPPPNYMWEQEFKRWPEEQLDVEQLEHRCWIDFCEQELSSTTFGQKLGNWIPDFADLGFDILYNLEDFTNWSRACPELTPLMAQLVCTGIILDWEHYRDIRMDRRQKR